MTDRERLIEVLGQNPTSTYTHYACKRVADALLAAGFGYNETLKARIYDLEKSSMNLANMLDVERTNHNGTKEKLANKDAEIARLNEQVKLRTSK